MYDNEVGYLCHLLSSNIYLLKDLQKINLVDFGTQKDSICR